MRLDKHFSLNQIDLNLLRTFDVLMQERSVSKAAIRLGRTQSATSHSLARLREILKDELFSRDGGNMEPTARAKELALVISRALSDIRQVVDSHLNFEPATTSRNFRIGLSDSAAVAILPTLLAKISTQAPNVTINVIHTREAEVVDLLKSKEIECAVLGNVSLKDEHLVIVPLGTHSMVCAGWTGNPLLDNFTQEAYLASPHLQISADGKASGVADVVLRGLGLTRNVVATIPHYLVAPWVIKGTSLITAFGDDFIFALSKETETRLVKCPFELPDVHTSMIFERTAEAEASHTWLREMITSTFATQRVLKQATYDRLNLTDPIRI